MDRPCCGNVSQWAESLSLIPRNDIVGMNVAVTVTHVTRSDLIKILVLLYTSIYKLNW